MFGNCFLPDVHYNLREFKSKNTLSGKEKDHFMKKRKRRYKRRKKGNVLLWVFIVATGIAALVPGVFIAGALKKKSERKMPEELLAEYMNHIPAQEYEQMYDMIHIEMSGNISREDFISRNSAIYEGIELQNMQVEVTGYDEERLAVSYKTTFDTVAGAVSFANEAYFQKGEEGYKLSWKDSLIFPSLSSTDRVRVSTVQAQRGEILDREGRMLAGPGTASSVGMVPGKLKVEGLSCYHLSLLTLASLEDAGSNEEVACLLTACNSLAKVLGLEPIAAGFNQQA